MTILLLRILVIFPNIYVGISALNSIIFSGKIVTAHPKLTVFVLFLSVINIAIGYAFGRQPSDNKTTEDLWAALRCLSIVGNGIGLFVAVMFSFISTSVMLALAVVFFATCLMLVTLFDIAVENNESADTPALKTPAGMENLDHFGRSILAHSKVYSSNQIFFAAIIGGIPAACWFLSRNFKVTGKPGVALILPWAGFVLALVAIFLMNNVVPKWFGGTGFGLCLAAAFKSTAKKYEGETQWALLNGASKADHGQVVLISVLWNLGWMLIVFLLMAMYVGLGLDLPDER